SLRYWHPPRSMEKMVHAVSVRAVGEQCDIPCPPPHVPRGPRCRPLFSQALRPLGDHAAPSLRPVSGIYDAKSKAFSKFPAPSRTPGSGSSAKRRVMNLMIDVVSYGV